MKTDKKIITAIIAIIFSSILISLSIKYYYDQKKKNEFDNARLLLKSIEEIFDEKNTIAEKEKALTNIQNYILKKLSSKSIAVLRSILQRRDKMFGCMSIGNWSKLLQFLMGSSINKIADLVCGFSDTNKLMEEFVNLLLPLLKQIIKSEVGKYDYIKLIQFIFCKMKLN
ncbi:hypothetical protein TCON_0323 [Astathelohania contejeani]|uniref:Transmembrane protein n=1 Tax=Astathelohania contejeani TaxID=164912 RepID=A0ABQ7I233_9MICR|nr:hypothetical protein TCON_0323 [Thelohania contejeani]